MLYLHVIASKNIWCIWGRIFYAYICYVYNNFNLYKFFYTKINRFHRTLKEKLLKYFTANDNTRWIDVIDKIIKNYNNTVNSSTGYTPTEASKSFIQTQLISKKGSH